MSGEELRGMSDEELAAVLARGVNVFARVVPEDKLRLVAAARRGGAITAMIGDGVNDAPALKTAEIGIAMGDKRATQVAREAADMVIMDDDLGTIVTAIRDGRRIYDNIRRSVAYVFMMHIPIMSAALLAPLLGVPPEAVMMLPLQVVLTELILDPVCSIVFERQGAEAGIMARPPRDPKQQLINKAVIGRIVMQGAAIAVASFGLYYYYYQTTGVAELARTMGVLTMSVASLLLVYVNSSESKSFFGVIKANLGDKVMWLINLVVIALLTAVIYVPWLSELLKFQSLSGVELLICLGLAAAAVLWYDVVKWSKRRLRARAEKIVREGGSGSKRVKSDDIMRG